MNANNHLFIQASSLPPVNMEYNKTPAQGTKYEEVQKIVDNTVDTSDLINKVLKSLETKEPDEFEWPIDANYNPSLKQSLSYTKMVNEVNHREPRYMTKANQIDKLPLCSTRIGVHSTSKRWRRSNVEALGPGINLYLKMLKYFFLIFFLAALISIPSLILFFNGLGYTNEDESFSQIFFRFTLGNLDRQTEITVSSLDMNRDGDSMLLLECPGMSKLKDVLTYGLAQNQMPVYG